MCLTSQVLVANTLAMRSYDSTDEYDQNEAKELKAEPWMLAQLDMNPGYTSWGPGEDYMKAAQGDRGGWDSGIEYADWKAMEFQLDELNECVNFHFEITRKAKVCEHCEQTGLAPLAKYVSDAFYRHSLPINNGRRGLPFSDATPEFHEFREELLRTGQAWNDRVTQDEVQALWDNHRLRCEGWETVPTAEEVNLWESGRGMGHDGINRHVLIKARCARLKIPYTCDHCNGSGTIYTEDKARLGLVLWMIHPRKGASRGVEILNIERNDLPAVYKWLREAATRNAERFSKAASVGFSEVML